jgi:hypothetical protein
VLAPVTRDSFLLFALDLVEAVRRPFSATLSVLGHKATPMAHPTISVASPLLCSVRISKFMLRTLWQVRIYHDQD